MQNKIPTHLTDVELVEAVTRLAMCERRTTMELVAHLAEMDRRKLYRGAGFPSMFAYCRSVLHLSEGGAYNRIEAARAANHYPVVLDLLGQGALNVATLRLLASHLTAENHAELLAEASFKSKREVEALLARRFPQSDVVASVRKLPAPSSKTAPSSSPAASGQFVAPLLEPQSGPRDDGAAPLLPAPAQAVDPAPVPGERPRPPLITPLAADRYQIRFTASADTAEKLRRAQDLLRHAIPDGDPAQIFDRALTALLDDLARRKHGATGRPRAEARPPSPESRTIPAHVRRAVVARDGGTCAFVAATGRRCGERAFLEFHHVVPYARGGLPTVVNIQLRCRAHNDYEAELDFGPRKGGHAASPTRPGTSSARAGAAPSPEE